MNIWVVICRWDYENQATTHLTEQGALLSAISEVLEYLEVHSDEDYIALLENNYDQQEQSEFGVWEPWKLKEQTVKELWEIYGYWTEFTWDRNADWEIIKTQVRP